jgi:hypothetical protein
MNFEWWPRPTDKTAKVRILADLGENKFHWVRTETESGYTRFHKKPCPDDDSCKLCDDPHPSFRQKTHRLFSVIDRSDGRVKLLDMPPQMQHELLGALRTSRLRNKNLSRFDIAITKEGQGVRTRYKVAIDPPKRLRVSEQEEALELLSKMIARLRPNCKV